MKRKPRQKTQACMWCGARLPLDWFRKPDMGKHKPGCEWVKVHANIHPGAVLTERGRVVDRPAVAHKANLETVIRAAKGGNLALIECQLKATGEKVAVLAAVNRKVGGGADFVPLAVFFNGNPYEMLNPPNPDGGFFTEQG